MIQYKQEEEIIHPRQDLMSGATDITMASPSRHLQQVDPKRTSLIVRDGRLIQHRSSEEPMKLSDIAEGGKFSELPRGHDHRACPEGESDRQEEERDELVLLPKQVLALAVLGGWVGSSPAQPDPAAPRFSTYHIILSYPTSTRMVLLLSIIAG